MRHATFPYAAALASLALLIPIGTGCDGCDADGGGSAGAEVEEAAERGPEGAPDPTIPPRETRLPPARGAAAPGCLAFCRKSLECADAEGRPVPPHARDCERSCSPGGTHAAAPPSVWDCADSPCGTAFQSCSMQAMMRHMRGSEVAVFPISCEGLCNKVAWCAERTGEPVGEAEQDCEAACGPGGAYADVGPREYRCAEAACGAELVNCRLAGGPANPPPRAPTAP